MKRKLTEPRDSINFRCDTCGNAFARKPDTVEPDEAAPHHPFKYSAVCDACGRIAPQASWERGLFKAWTSATGPKTEEGKAATAKNLEGHPTPEEALRTRFNAMKHGMSARVAQYFPAKPDGYTFCQGCEVDRDWCARQAACVRRTELFMLHHAAIEQRDPKILGSIHADLQASLMSLLQMCIQTVTADGVKLTSPKFYTDKEGDLRRVEFMNADTGVYDAVVEYEMNPLLKIISDLISKNNLSLGDLGITQRIIERNEEEELGNVAGTSRDKEVLADIAGRQATALDNLTSLIALARDKRKHDPVLIEHEAQEGGRS